MNTVHIDRSLVTIDRAAASKKDAKKSGMGRVMRNVAASVSAPESSRSPYSLLRKSVWTHFRRRLSYSSAPLVPQPRFRCLGVNWPRAVMGAHAAYEGDGKSLSDLGDLRKVRIAVVGDVHDQWDSADEVALGALKCDLVIFVGDFGNERVDLVRAIAKCPLPKAVILGNHDAWYTLTGRGSRAQQRATLAGVTVSTSRVQQQLDALGDDHVGFAAKYLPEKTLAVVGARPFSRGGARWADERAFYQRQYGIADYSQSAKRIADTVLAQPAGTTIVMVGHNGPAGLGSERHDPVGKDFGQDPGDFGDSDAQEALERIKGMPGRRVALFAFGHMHERLQKGAGNRRMVSVDVESGTVFLNAAVVPRWQSTANFTPAEFAGVGMEGRGQNAVGGVLRHFMVVELERGVVRKVEERWVGVWRGSHEGGGPEARPVTSKTLLRLVSAAPIEEQSGSRLGGVGDMLGQQEGEMALEYEVFDGYERRMRLVRAKVSVDLNAGEGTEAASSWYEDMQRESTVLEPPLKRAKAAVNGD